jgi:VIT1/CCC1 family predicted Fe2+/Mn2+ transporter
MESMAPRKDLTAPSTHRPEDHRQVQSGAARAAVFGVSDGLTTNVALILGVAGAHASSMFVRVAGLAGLFAGAFSMAAGEYVSMRAQSELLSREIHLEEVAQQADPVSEQRELADIYRARGFDERLAQEVAAALMRDPGIALEAHAREELGIGIDQLGSPIAAAVSSFVAFSTGALVPLLPWFFLAGSAAIVASVLGAAAAALAVGVIIGMATGRSRTRTALRQLAIGALAAGSTFLIGRVAGA